MEEQIDMNIEDKYAYKALIEAKNTSKILQQERADVELYLNRERWWKEIAGVFCTFPRQTGKSTALCSLLKEEMKNNIEDFFLVVVPNFSSGRIFDTIKGPQVCKVWSLDTFKNLMCEKAKKSIHVYMDEYKYMDKGLVAAVLSHPSIVSVTAVSSES